MAHTKSQGSVKGNKDSIAKRLGVKLFGGQIARPGNIIIRQKGTKFHSGAGTSIGKDYTIYAIEEGEVSFRTAKGKKFVEVLHGRNTNH